MQGLQAEMKEKVSDIGKWRDQSFLPKVSITNILARWKIFPRVTTLSPTEYFFFPFFHIRATSEGK